MTCFDPYFLDALARRDAASTRRFLRPVEREPGFLLRDGRKSVDVASNDYLGLADHPVLRQRAAEWTQRYGTGARASRLISGTLAIHRQVESKLAAFKGTEDALLFTSGWQANASVLPALCALSVAQTGHQALLFMDRLNHASLYHGCAASGLRPIRFRHNDLAHLDTLLHGEKDTPGLRFIITESVFSMDGDRADLPALRRLADRYGAFLYVDEAHATGVLGENGRGLSAGLADLTMSTASKALGSMGAYIAGSTALCAYLLNHASGFVYSTALAPPVLGAIDAALDLIPQMADERRHLHALAERLRARLNAAGLQTAASTTQIVPVMTGTAERALTLATRLEEEGFFATAIRPPTVPPQTSRLRLALHARLSAEDVESLADTLILLSRTLG